MRFLSILMFAFAIAIGISCSTASATAINLGQEYDVGFDFQFETVTLVASHVDMNYRIEAAYTSNFGDFYPITALPVIDVGESRSCGDSATTYSKTLADKSTDSTDIPVYRCARDGLTRIVIEK